METEQYYQDAIREQSLVPLFYHDDPATCTGILQALYSVGIRLVEFTNRGDQALSNFETLVQERDKNMSGLHLGVGTIRTPDQASRFIDLGADLLISPLFDSGICDIAYMQKILWIPGCMTPTEIQTAASAGCVLIKLFPGNLLGPGFVEAVRPLFPGIDYMITGGVEADEANFRSWFHAGAVALGMGSKLITREDADNKNFSAIAERAALLLQWVQQAKKQ